MIRIGAFIKQSFIDWDGKVSAVIFTKGCNFRCWYCHNPSLVIPQLYNNYEDLSINDVFNYLKERKGWIDGVVITGGEPTVNDDLPEFILQIKSMGFQVKLDTNGSNPNMLEYLIRKKLIDFIALDIKTMLDASFYEKIINIPSCNIIDKLKESLNIIENSNISHHFRTTLTEQHSNGIIEKLTESFGKDKIQFQHLRQGEMLMNYI